MLTFKGFFKVVHFMALVTRTSTSFNYQLKWKRFRKWCKDNRVTFTDPTVQKVTVFFHLPETSW